MNAIFNLIVFIKFNQSSRFYNSWANTLSSNEISVKNLFEVITFKDTTVDVNVFLLSYDNNRRVLLNVMYIQTNLI